jgi:thiamine pyrophosphokinase
VKILRAFLWCNGEAPSEEKINSLGKLSPLFGVDGGANKAISCGFFVEEALGDLDSIKKSGLELEMTKLPDESYSDLTKTIQELEKRGYLEFDILGIDGGAPGHILGIWGSLAESSLKLKIRLHHKNAISYRITPENGEFSININEGRKFSVFALTLCERVSIKGAKWELEDEYLKLSTKGLHNIGNGELLKIKSDGLVALIIED